MVAARPLRRRRSRSRTFDLDRFKALNDSLGHAAGDAAIRRFGEIVREAVRATDIACRYGGEEFAILFPESDARRGPRGRRARAPGASRPSGFEFAGKPFRITVSAGVAEAEGTPPDRDEMLVPRGQGALRRQGGRAQPGPVWAPRRRPRRRDAIVRGVDRRTSGSSKK